MIQYTEETQDERQANYDETLQLLICAMQQVECGQAPTVQQVNALTRAIAQI